MICILFFSCKKTWLFYKRNVINLIIKTSTHLPHSINSSTSTLSRRLTKKVRVPRTRGSSNRLTFRRFWFYPRPLPTPPPEPPPPSPSSAHNACPFVPFAPSPQTPTPRARFARSSALSGPPGRSTFLHPSSASNESLFIHDPWGQNSSICLEGIQGFIWWTIIREIFIIKLVKIGQNWWFYG